VQEEALRGALRALYDKESIAEQMAAESDMQGHAPEQDYAGIARRCREEVAQLLALPPA
jgi:SHS2 domain-containing protein